MMVTGMAQVISHPFRLSPTGEVETVDDDSTQAHAEAIAVIATTRLGERAMEPSFGVADPTFAELDVAEVQANLAAFGPDGVDVVGAVTTPVSADHVEVELTFKESAPDE